MWIELPPPLIMGGNDVPQFHCGMDIVSWIAEAAQLLYSTLTKVA
jgi:hypothetical protein